MKSNQALQQLDDRNLQHSRLQEYCEYFPQLNKTYRYKDDDTGSEYILKPASEFKIDVQIDYNSKVLQVSSAQLNSLSDFNNEISR